MIGGEIGNVFRVKCIKYNYKVNKWKEVLLMKYFCSVYCVVVLEEFIYVMVGCDDNVCFKSVECYIFLSDEWSQIVDMNNVRKFVVVVVIIIDEKIIVVGGYSEMDCFIIIISCEIFNKSLNQWSLVFVFIVLRAVCGIVSVENYVYVFGGERELSYDDFDSVECYVI